MNQEDFDRFYQAAHVAVPTVGWKDGKPYAIPQFNLKRFAELIWEEAYDKGHDEGWEQAILKERG